MHELDANDDLGKTPAKARPSSALDEMVQSDSRAVLLQAASSPQLSEDLALVMLARRDLPGAVIEALARNPLLMNSRQLKEAVVRHQHTPKHVALPMARHLYTFELMQIALAPAIPADIKVAVEQVIESRISKLSAGERLTLARRASGKVAAALLFDSERRIIEAALDNPYLTETLVVKRLMIENGPQSFIEAVCAHTKWSVRRDIRAALIRHAKTPLGRVLVYARSLPSYMLRDVLTHSRVDASVKIYLLQELHEREAKMQEEQDAG